MIDFEFYTLRVDFTSIVNQTSSQTINTKLYKDISTKGTKATDSSAGEQLHLQSL